MGGSKRYGLCPIKVHCLKQASAFKAGACFMSLSVRKYNFI